MTKLEQVSNVKPRLPRQIYFIIGNEGCERFSFYGMRNILTQFLVSSSLLFTASQYLSEADRQGAAKDVFHTFVLGVYFFPLLGGWLSDRFLGKYRTILYLSLVYCAGHACLALCENNRTGFFTGLFLIALGSGGIKPLVSAYVGDQLDQTNKSIGKVAFDAFYWIINFGSFFASLLMPIFLKNYGPSVAFGIPGVLMFIATLIFWYARKDYVNLPPTPAHPDSFLAVLKSALLAPGSGGAGRPGLTVAMLGALLASVCLALGVADLARMLSHSTPWLGVTLWWCLALVLAIGFVGAGARLQLDRALAKHSPEAVEGVRNVLRILVLFFLVTPFWSLFDQKASTWVLQAGAMTKPSWFQPSQMQALNPLLVMLLIPFNNAVLYPALKRFGYEATALRRMTAGIAIAGFSWIIAGSLQLAIEGGASVSITWQILPYIFLTLGEVLVSATGLEFAYSQAPLSMKGAIMAFWTLSVTVGNLWVLLSNWTVRNEKVTQMITGAGLQVVSFQMFFFAGFAIVAAAAFGFFASKYTMSDNYRRG
jgi:proton-dependent oligopeptide transporter, POT family